MLQSIRGLHEESGHYSPVSLSQKLFFVCGLQINVKQVYGS